MIAHIRNGQSEETVWEHCRKVAMCAQTLGKRCGMENLARLAGMLHDMGKSTAIFEEYLRCVSDGQEWEKPKVNHSSSGAIWLAETFPGQTLFEKLTTEMLSWAIMSHHGICNMLDIDGTDYYEKRLHPEKEIYYDEAIEHFFTDCKEDIRSIYRDAVLEVQKNLGRMKTAIKHGVELNQLKSKEGCEKELHFELGMQMRLLLSILIDSDRLETARYMGGTIQEFSKEWSVRLWEKLIPKLEKRLQQFGETYIENAGRRELFQIRNDIAQKCLKKADLPMGIYTLQVPTGGGKSLASMRFALHHAKEHKAERIFYIAPFRTILEQTAETYRSLFDEDQSGHIILEHHSDIIIERDDEEAQALIERWASPIILTTFVQFLNTLFSNRSQCIRRTHALANAVIIIDEIQSLPIKTAAIFNWAMNFLKEINTTVILCSATQPTLSEIKHSLFIDGSLVNQTDLLFRKMQRTSLVNYTHIRTVEQIGGLASEKVADLPCGLIILNTRSAAQKVYESILERDLPNTTVIYLSTFMCAQHRIDRLQEYKEYLSKARISGGMERVICVSTQLIEAGVDIDADWVIRSVAGWDSILQASGRCNREALRENGNVYLVHCEEEKLVSLPDIQDGKRITDELLLQRNTEDENGMLESLQMIEHYYRSYFYEKEKQGETEYPIRKGIIKSTILELLSENEKGVNNWKNRFPEKRNDVHMANQAFREAGECFRVIADEMQAVLVPYEKGQEYIACLNSEISFKEQESILQKAQRYTVNARECELKKYLAKGMIYQLHACDAYALADGFYGACGVTESAELETLFM